MAVTRFAESNINGSKKYNNFKTNVAGTYPLGSQSYSDLLTMGGQLVNFDAMTPAAGGVLTINGENVGLYDLTIKKGAQTVSAFSAGDWFTATADRSAIIAIDGNLTIDAGQTFIPGVRKLFTFIYVSGDFECNGTVSMSSRGANHTGTGTSNGATTAAAIRIGTGDFGGVTNPEVPATGGAGGASRNDTSGSGTGINGLPGSTGTNGGTGGGGSGASRRDNAPNTAISGAGATGTSFSGGAGSGGAMQTNGPSTSSSAGGANGGAGSNGAFSGANAAASGGAGNPGGTGGGNNGFSGGSGATGTGGILIIYASGTISGSGSFVAAGAAGGSGQGSGGAGSGGGSVTVIAGASSGVTVSAPGGAGGNGSNSGGAGGAGTARILAQE